MHAAAAKRGKTGTRVRLRWPVTAEVDSLVTNQNLKGDAGKHAGACLC